MSRVVVAYKESLQEVAKDSGITFELGETAASASGGPKFSLIKKFSCTSYSAVSISNQQGDNAAITQGLQKMWLSCVNSLPMLCPA